MAPIAAEPGQPGRRLPPVWPLLRSAASVGLLMTLYYTLPLDRPLDAAAATVMALGLTLFGCLVAWQIAAIVRAAYPRLRAIEALATAVPLFLLLFSTAYFLFARDRPPSFSEPLSRTDALYFTVTVFATVGFGDIVPISGTTRALTTVQMVADLILVGVIAKVVYGAVQAGLRRRNRPHGSTVVRGSAITEPAFRREAGMDEHFVWVTTRRIRPGALEDFERAWRPPSPPPALRRAFAYWSEDGQEITGVSFWDSKEACDAWRNSDAERQRREAMAPYVVEEREGFYRGGELSVPVR